MEGLVRAKLRPAHERGRPPELGVECNFPPPRDDAGNRIGGQHGQNLGFLTGELVFLARSVTK